MNIFIALDWDDTLFPRAKLDEILARKPGKELWSTKAEELQSKMTMIETLDLMRLSEKTWDLLSSCISTYSKRNVCIVTASEPGWIKEALSIVEDIGYYSAIHDLLFNENKKDIKDRISIHHLPQKFYESLKKEKHNQLEHPCLRWKCETFQRIFNQKAIILKNLSRNRFLIVGDSLFDYVAAKRLNKYIIEKIGTKKSEYVSINRIKLIHEPTIRDLIGEQDILKRFCENNEYYHHSLFLERSLDITYLKEMNKKFSVY